MTRSTTLSNLTERELRLLLDGIDHLVADLESAANDVIEPSMDHYDWDDIARMRERIQGARRRVRETKGRNAT